MSLPTEPDEKRYHPGYRERLTWLLSVASPGDEIKLCRTQGIYCDTTLQPICSMCKVVEITRGLTVEDLLAIKLEN